MKCRVVFSHLYIIRFMTVQKY